MSNEKEVDKSFDFSGDISGFEKRELKDDVKKFVEESKNNETLKQHGVAVYTKEEVEAINRRTRTYKNISIFLIIVILGLGATFAYLTQQGKFQSNINQSLSCPQVNLTCPEITIPPYPACPQPAPIYINLSCTPFISRNFTW